MTRRRVLLLALAVLLLTVACVGGDPLGGNGGQDAVDRINAAQATRAIEDLEATKEAYNGQ